MLITILLFFYNETKVVLKNSFYISKILYVTLLNDDPILMQFTSKDNKFTNQNNDRQNQSLDLLKYNSAIRFTDVVLDTYASRIKFGFFTEKNKIIDIVKKKNYQVYFNSEQELKNDNIIQFEIIKTFKNYDFDIQDDYDLLLANNEVKKIVYQIILDQVKKIDVNFNKNLDKYIFHTYIVSKIPFSYYRYISTYVFLLIFINFIIVFIKFRKKILI